MEHQLPDYATVTEVLERIDNGYSAAEIHGSCSGLLVVNQSADQNSWLRELLEGDAQNFHFQEARTLLRELFVITRQQLNDPGMGFELLLPDEDELEAQVAAMQDWCQGFGLGLTIAGIKEKDMQTLPADSKEWVEDVVRIGTSGELDLDNEAESEDALAEIIEYLRVGVLMMNEEMQPLKSAPHVH